MELNLEGKRAFVGGGSQGIGKAIAIALANQGASVTIAARNKNGLMNVLTELETSKGQDHDCLEVDYADPDRLNGLVSQLMTSNERHYNILINNTGGPAAGPIYKANTEEFLAAITRHVVCNQVLTKLMIPGMRADKYGRIINIISTSVKEPIENLGVSNTTRGAVASWAKTMSKELGQYGITVNNVLPGFTQTPRLDALIEGRASKAGKIFEEVAQGMKDRVPLHRFAEAAEVANAVGFLASPSASYISGINLPVDGGRLGCL